MKDTFDANCASWKGKDGVEAVEDGNMNKHDLKCKSCVNVATHFYDESNQLCVERTLVPNCKTYKIKTNECETCNDGYYLEGVICK